MKLHFDPNQQFQIDAIQSIIDIFEGQPLSRGDFDFSFNSESYLFQEGRIGRLLIPLFLYMKKSLNSPMFYLSEYLEAHRDEYYDGLLAITSENNWQGWIEYFLQAIIIQSDTNISKAKDILHLYENLKDEFINTTHSQYAVPALDTFFKAPIINTVDFIKLSGIPNKVTVNDLLRKLAKIDIIKTLRKGRGRMPTVYALPDLLNIAEGKKIL